MALADAMGHPVKGLILSTISDEPGLTVKELGGRLGAPVHTINYHLRGLLEDELVIVSETADRRGTRERRFEAARHYLVSDEEARRLSPQQLSRIALSVIRAVLAEANRAAKAGGLHRDGDAWIHVKGRVDDEGWDELLEIHEGALREFERVRRESAERCGEAAPPLAVTSALIFFRRDDDPV